MENTKKTKRLSKEEFKKDLINSRVNNDVIETAELNKKADRLQKPEDAAAVIQAYENIIPAKKKGIICIAYQQVKLFKRLKDKEKFVQLVKDFQVQKSTIIFKTNVFNVIEKFRGLKKSSLTLGFLKNYYKHIKNVLKENPSEFAKVKVICLRKLFVKLSLQFIMLQKYSDKF